MLKTRKASYLHGIIGFLSLCASWAPSQARADDMTFEDPGLELTESLQMGVCWQAEGFSSESEYRQQLSSWEREAVPFPGPMDAYVAYRVFKNEAKLASDSLRNDKKVHCYMGCRIAQDANFATAQWAGWEKEKRDLTDCKSSSHFEILDYTATVVGAHIGATERSKDACLRQCDRDF